MCQHQASEATAFTTLAWISTLQWSVQALPGIYRAVANLKPSFDRIDRFLTTPISVGEIPELPELPEMPEPGSVGVDSVDVELASLPSMPRRPWHEEPWLSTSAYQGLASSNTGTAVDVQGAAFGYRRWHANCLEETCVLDQVSFQATSCVLSLRHRGKHRGKRFERSESS